MLISAFSYISQATFPCMPLKQKINNKHLMIGSKGNSEFCFLETLDVHREGGDIESRGETKLAVSRGDSH